MLTYFTAIGSLYGLGSNSSGQLGIGNTASQSTPQLVRFYAKSKGGYTSDEDEHRNELRVNVVQVACGTGHTLALSGRLSH